MKSSIRTFFVCSIALVLLSVVATAEVAADDEWRFEALEDDEWRFPTDRISAELLQTYRDETLAKPSVRAYEAANQLIIEVPQEGAIYVFTTAAHFAHPAMVKRRMVLKEGAYYSLRKGHYAGDVRAFSRWWKQFDELDAKMKSYIDQNLRKTPSDK